MASTEVKRVYAPYTRPSAMALDPGLQVLARDYVEDAE